MAENSGIHFLFLLLSGLLTKRLNSYLEDAHIIPAEQCGFERERFTETGCEIQMANIRTQATTRGLLYMVLGNFKVISDSRGYAHTGRGGCFYE